MVMRTIEIRFEVERDRQERAIEMINRYYPELEVYRENNEIVVKGDLSNYKRRSMIIWILSGGKHGQNIQAN